MCGLLVCWCVTDNVCLSFSNYEAKPKMMVLVVLVVVSFTKLSWPELNGRELISLGLKH